uniref:Pre-SET domain-containing protein n=1 Tax=Panagrellus redivivus TaxID=6233 RepID=A0A7E4UY87_PANRE
MGNSTSKKDNVIHADIADGNEPIPIKVINNYNEKQPFPFQYGTEYRLSEKVKSLTYQPTESDGCNCVAECTSELCRCESSSTATFDTINRRMQTFIDSYTCGDHQYIECGQHCGCMAKCKRRLTRDTIMKNIEVRYKPDVGFTVIACQHIAAGMPIMNYIGNVVIQEELEKNLNAIWGTDYTFNFHNEVRVLF